MEKNVSKAISDFVEKVVLSDEKDKPKQLSSAGQG